MRTQRTADESSLKCVHGLETFMGDALINYCQRPYITFEDVLEVLIGKVDLKPYSVQLKLGP